MCSVAFRDCPPAGENDPRRIIPRKRKQENVGASRVDVSEKPSGISVLVPLRLPFGYQSHGYRACHLVDPAAARPTEAACRRRTRRRPSNDDPLPVKTADQNAHTECPRPAATRCSHTRRNSSGALSARLAALERRVDAANVSLVGLNDLGKLAGKCAAIERPDPPSAFQYACRPAGHLAGKSHPFAQILQRPDQIEAMLDPLMEGDRNCRVNPVEAKVDQLREACIEMGISLTADGFIGGTQCRQATQPVGGDTSKLALWRTP